MEKVDKNVLKARVTVRGGSLFGKLVEPGVLFMKCLLETELESGEGNTGASIQKLTLTCQKASY